QPATSRRRREKACFAGDIGAFLEGLRRPSLSRRSESRQKTPFPKRGAACTMRALAEGATGNRPSRGPETDRPATPPGSKKTPHGVLTFPKKQVRCAAPSGTLVTRTEQGTEAGSTIFDSVRR